MGSENADTVRVYSRELGWSVPDSIVRNSKQAYLRNLQVVRNPDEVQLREKVREPPLKLRCLDSLVQDYVKHLRLSEELSADLLWWLQLVA